jgi:hypothetical protein
MPSRSCHEVGATILRLKISNNSLGTAHDTTTGIVAKGLRARKHSCTRVAIVRRSEGARKGDVVLVEESANISSERTERATIVVAKEVVAVKEAVARGVCGVRGGDQRTMGGGVRGGGQSVLPLR